MTAVFVSFARGDIVKVSSIVNELIIAGLEVWWDQKLEPAEKWREFISEKITQSSIFVVALTPDSVVSEWVRKEYTLALSRQFEAQGFRILPIMLEKCSIPTQLTELNVIDMTDYPDSLWGLIGLIKTISPSLVNNDFNSYTAPNARDKSRLAHLPAWKRSIEIMILADEFLSRSVLTLAARCNLSVLEITKYCLSAEHISLSPFFTPGSQPIPHFGRKEKLLKRYNGNENFYLDELLILLGQVKQRKMHREIKQSWQLIQEHFEKAFLDNSYLAHTKESGRLILTDQTNDLVFILAELVEKQWHRKLELILKKNGLPYLINTSHDLIFRPITYLMSNLSSSNVIIVDTSANAASVNFTLGYLQSSVPQTKKVFLVSESEQIPDSIFPVKFGTQCLPQTLLRIFDQPERSV